ncbi:MAG TPA: ATP-binding protein [Candidatus Sulfotelmatobacter sp.]|jgi:predicted ATPase
MLKRIRIKGYKSFAELNLSLKPLSVLIGPNSAGKSNFLDALQLLSRMATKPTLKEAFDSPYRGTPLESFSFVGEGVHSQLSLPTLSFAFEVDVSLSDGVVENVNSQIREMRSSRTHDSSDPSDSPSSKTKGSYITRRNLRYKLEVEIIPKSGILRVKDEFLVALNERGEQVTRPLPFIEKIKDKLHVRMEGQSHPTYHDRYLDHTIISRPLYPPHYPHLVAMRQELASWFIFYFEPRERMRAANPVKEVRSIGLMGEELASFLNTLQAVDTRQFQGIEKSLHMIIPSITGLQVSVNTLGEVELQVREGSVSVPARVVSEGTLRVLGLLALGGMKDSPALIGFEEPENGVHPRRIQLIAELLKNMTNAGNTQLVVTTHSPILTGMIPDESLYTCKKERGATTIEPFKTWGTLARESDVDDALNRDGEGSDVPERILRGDFDA